MARLVRWLRRAVLSLSVVLLPRLLFAAADPAAAAAEASWKPTKLGRLPSYAEMNNYLLPFFAKYFTMENQYLRYGSIPIVAGLLNWATNRLAVLMMFYPLKFRGFGLRRIGRIGWQGIVPNKARSMANSIVDDVMLRLIDLRVVFGRLPPEEIAKALEPTVERVGEGLARDLLERKGWDSLAGGVIDSAAFRDTLRDRGRSLVADFVRDVQVDPAAVFDLRSVVVSGLSSDPKALVQLFERCGERDLRFVVNSGLVLGGLLGIGQMLLWIAWSPWWSLALTGALVGMVTDQLALKLIFEPVEPRKIGPFVLQGLFLKCQEYVQPPPHAAATRGRHTRPPHAAATRFPHRVAPPGQRASFSVSSPRASLGSHHPVSLSPLPQLSLLPGSAVSREFADFMAANVLTAPRLWSELLSGTRSSGFWRLLSLRIDSALGVAPDGGLPNFAGQTLYQLLGKEDWEWLRREAAVRMQAELPAAVHTVYGLTEESLALEATMVEEMGKLSSAEFERVLHPVFEEDEWTLILVGTALGGIAGLLQALI